MSFWGLSILGTTSGRNFLDFISISFQSRLLKVSHSLGIWVARDSVAEQNRSFRCDPCASLGIGEFSFALSKAPESTKNQTKSIKINQMRLNLIKIDLVWLGARMISVPNHPIWSCEKLGIHWMCPRQAGQLPPFGFYVGFMEEKLTEQSWQGCSTSAHNFFHFFSP